MMTGGVIILAKGGDKLATRSEKRRLILGLGTNLEKNFPKGLFGKFGSEICYLFEVGAALLAIGYGLMLNVFKRKYHGYPYSFFLG